MEIVESTTGVSQKQMNEALTVATTSAEGSNVNVSVGGNSTAAAAATANLTAETRTKDINTTKTITASTAGSTDILLQKDIDMDIEEILTKSTLKADFTKVDDKTHQSTVKLMSTNTATIPIQLDDDIPIISLSDSEDVVIQPTTTSQKSSRKRNSVGGAATAEEDQQFRLKRRKIKVAGAPKMPLTGYVRYMNDRRELLRKELPTKTAIEHTKIIGEEWQKMSEDKKAPYMKAAEVDKQRYLAELHTFLKERPDVLACELAKDKQAKKLEHGKTVLKEKSQSVGNIKSPNKDSNASTTTNKAEKSRRSADKDNSSSSPPPPPRTSS
uniref:High mobility group protein 20A n=1 Tax=Ceratitis capitata TaxID=7213 RepID=W8APW6_CERCA